MLCLDMQIRIGRLFRNILIKSINRSMSTSIDMATSSTNVHRQKFDYLLILDFEATCDTGMNQPRPQEIIEFPCLKMNTRTWQIESQFHRYVRPVANPILSSFCTDLTGIVQEMVDDQSNLDETMKLFDQWLREEKLINDRSIGDQESLKWEFVTCGDWDLKTMLKQQCDYFGYERREYYRSWINIKKIYFQETKQFPKGMLEMLEKLNLKHEGRHHSGIDDTKNIAQIVKFLGARGCFFDVTGIEK